MPRLSASGAGAAIARVELELAFGLLVSQSTIREVAGHSYVDPLGEQEVVTSVLV